MIKNLLSKIYLTIYDNTHDYVTSLAAKASFRYTKI